MRALKIDKLRTFAKMNADAITIETSPNLIKKPSTNAGLMFVD